MTKQKQYYTPDISEFHVGFEYEEKTEVLGGHVWELLGFDVDIGYDSLSYLIERDMVRVAYLTPKQIESRGWAFDGDYELRKSHYVVVWCGEDESLGGSIDIKISGGCIFSGYIKNINEFDRLCKQLGITE